MSRLIRHCGECGWKDSHRDKHVDVLDHYCAHPAHGPYLPSVRIVERRRRLQIVSGETGDLDEEGWPEIPDFCPLEPHIEHDCPLHPEGKP